MRKLWDVEFSILLPRWINSGGRARLRVGGGSHRAHSARQAVAEAARPRLQRPARLRGLRIRHECRERRCSGPGPPAAVPAAAAAADGAQRPAAAATTTTTTTAAAAADDDDEPEPKLHEARRDAPEQEDHPAALARAAAALHRHRARRSESCLCHRYCQQQHHMGPREQHRGEARHRQAGAPVREQSGRLEAEGTLLVVLLATCCSPVKPFLVPRSCAHPLSPSYPKFARL